MSNYKFIPVDEIPRLTRKARNQEVLEAFLESGMEICELQIDSNTKNVYNSMFCSAKRFSLPVDIFCRHGKVYLARRKI